MIIGDPCTIAVYLEYIHEYGYPRGMFNFIIEENFFPGESTNIDLAATVTCLKESLEKESGKNIPDTGNFLIECMDFSAGHPENLLVLNAGQLHDYGFSLWLGFDGDEERLIYTQDYGKTRQEVRFPAGVVENLIRSLPDVTDLVMEEYDGIFITTLKPKES